MLNFLKISFLVTWGVVLIAFLWPNISEKISTANSETFGLVDNEVGLVLTPMRPVTERIFVSTSVSYPSTSAEKIDGYYLSGSFTTKDLRTLALQSYLASKKSPMTSYAEEIVRVSDASNIDFRTFVAISGVESGFGKVGHAAKNGHNPIGWRGGPGGKFNIFSSWPESINYLIPRLARGYGSKPDPFLIQSTYCPPCGAAGTNEWANGVTKNLNEIDAVYVRLKD